MFCCMYELCVKKPNSLRFLILSLVPLTLQLILLWPVHQPWMLQLGWQKDTSYAYVALRCAA